MRNGDGYYGRAPAGGYYGGGGGASGSDGQGRKLERNGGGGAWQADIMRRDNAGGSSPRLRENGRWEYGERLSEDGHYRDEPKRWRGSNGAGRKQAPEAPYGRYGGSNDLKVRSAANRFGPLAAVGRRAPAKEARRWPSFVRSFALGVPMDDAYSVRYQTVKLGSACLVDRLADVAG